MSTQQPEALRLADECGTGYPLEEDAKKAAAELRRLHAELESIKQAITDPENQPSQYGTVLMSDQPENSAPVFKPCSCRWNGETQGWEVAMKTTGSDFKISNDHIAFYARLFVKVHPQYRFIFNLKRMADEPWHGDMPL